MADRQPWSEHDVEAVIGNLLRFGVLTAALVVLAGGVIFLVRHGGELEDHRVFRGQPAELTSLRGIVQGSLAGRGLALIQLGLVLLIATPVARVAFSAYAFARQGDLLYVGITLIVLAVLVGSLLMT